MNAKRLFDIVFSAAALIVAAPLMLLIALLIQISSPGPVFYKADRAGKDFQKFQIFKFRSMRVNRDRAPEITTRDDPRIYPLGKILRKSKLDELPQLINVLRGEMSIVGPRPEDYSLAIRFFTGDYREVLSVRPGLTSPASLLDYTHGETVSSTEEYMDRFFFQKRMMDLQYIKNQSIAWDIRIIVKTAFTILCVCGGRKRFRYPVEYVALLNRQ